MFLLKISVEIATKIELICTDFLNHECFEEDCTVKLNLWQSIHLKKKIELLSADLISSISFSLFTLCYS